MVTNTPAKELINLSKYPIHQRNKHYYALLEQIHQQLASDGCAVLRDFLMPNAIEQLVAEADGVAHLGHRSSARTNPYFTKDDPTLPADDPRRSFFDRSNNFIAADNFAAQGTLRRIHDFPDFDPFIRDCLQAKRFHRYADPLADVIINMAERGNGFPWHFDTNNFTVTLAIQNAETGGEFEYAPNIRKGDENFSEVKRVLDGCSDNVVKLALQPGDLQLFKGRYSLHRVAPLAGDRPRYVAILSYVEQPNMIGSPERSRQLYGKALKIHFDKAGMRDDSYID